MDIDIDDLEVGEEVI